MRIYQQIYGTVGEVAKLERTERRYQWLKKRLDDRPEQWAVFPSSWRVPQLVAISFCKATKSQLAEILDQVYPQSFDPCLVIICSGHTNFMAFIVFGSSLLKRWLGCRFQGENLRENVAGLLKAVVDTNRFERDMLSRFGGGSMDVSMTFSFRFVPDHNHLALYPFRLHSSFSYIKLW